MIGTQQNGLGGAFSAAGEGRHRAGHTLPEVLLVLTILAMLAAIAIPRFAAAMFRTHLDGAFRAIRADISYSRARAISTGLRHQLMVDTQSKELLVQPFHPEDAIAGSTGAATSTASPNQVDVSLRDRIPDDVKIVEWNVAPLGFDTGGAAAATTSQGDSQPLVFYAEGTSDTLEAILEDSQGNRRGLQLDGNTGEIREMTADDLQQRK